MARYSIEANLSTQLSGSRIFEAVGDAYANLAVARCRLSMSQPDLIADHQAAILAGFTRADNDVYRHDIWLESRENRTHRQQIVHQ